MNIDLDALFMMSEIFDKMDVKKVEGKTMEEVGNNIYLQLIKNSHKAKKEIKDLIKYISGRKVDTLKLRELKEIFDEVKESEDVKIFFTKQ